MTYRPPSLQCHHVYQNTQGSNQHQFRITCRQCQGHLAIVYGRHLTVNSRRLIDEHLRTAPEYILRPDQLPPRRREQHHARAPKGEGRPQDAPEPTQSPEDVEVVRARLCLRMRELKQEVRKLQEDLDNLPRPTTQSSRLPSKGGSGPPEGEAEVPWWQLEEGYDSEEVRRNAKDLPQLIFKAKIPDADWEEPETWDLLEDRPQGATAAAEDTPGARERQQQ